MVFENIVTKTMTDPKMAKYAYLIPIEVILVKSISKTFLKHSDKLRKSNSEICTFRLTLL